MNGSVTRASRIARARGLRRLAVDGATALVEEFLAPVARGHFERQALGEVELAAICRAEETFFDHYAPEESFTLELPITPGGYSDDELAWMTETYASGMTIDPPYVCELRDVELFGPDAVPLKDGGLVYENSFESWQRLTTSSLVAIGHGERPRPAPSQVDDRFDAVLSLVGPWNRNYTHWFQDYLGRLEGLEYLSARVDIEPDLLIPSDASQWMCDALEAMGYPPDRWIEWNGGRAEVERFVVASVRREDRERARGRRLLYSPTEFRWIRNRILENVEPEQTVHHTPRVFISRGNDTVRRITNEDETMELLSKWGFERYRPEELSFAEQVTLFSNAEAIVSSHGSGLMNQIFATDATVIEIFGPKHGVTDPAIEYFLADLLGHDYGCLQGETVGPDVWVDVGELETLLEMMLGE